MYESHGFMHSGSLDTEYVRMLLPIIGTGQDTHVSVLSYAYDKLFLKLPLKIHFGISNGIYFNTFK